MRLDKNERVINFEKKLLEYIKKKINLYHLAAYPNLLKLKKIISKRLKIKNNNIFLSAGSDLSLKTCIEVFTNHNEKVLILKPTFGMVKVYCDLYKLKTIEMIIN